MAHIHEKIDFIVSAYIVHDRKVLMVFHKELQCWLPVGGHIELDENPEQALFREIQEETGIDQNNVTVLSSKAHFSSSDSQALYTPNFLNIHKINDAHQHIGLIYILISRTNAIQLAEQEHEAIRWFSRDDLDNPEYSMRENVHYYANQALTMAANHEV